MKCYLKKYFVLAVACHTHTNFAKKLILFLYATALSLTTPLLAQNANPENTEQLINRRVFILHFVNATKSDAYSYLEESIPDAFSDPLDKTKSFEMISSDKWKEFVESEKFKKEDAWTEKKAVEAGKLAAADVVVIGKFVAMGDKIQIFSKAIELSSRRVMVSRNKTAPLDNNLFAAINEMTAEMSAEMKEKLPPLPQRVITVEREKYITVEKPVENGHTGSLQGEITLGGMFWRNLLLPGMGQVYAGSWHGWIYSSLWVGGAGAFTYFLIDYIQKEQDYLNGTEMLQTKYDAYSSAGKLVGYTIIGIGSLYVISLLDAVIFGKQYPKMAVSTGRESTGQFLAIIVPGLSKSGNEGYYAEVRYEKKF